MLYYEDHAFSLIKIHVDLKNRAETTFTNYNHHSSTKNITKTLTNIFLHFSVEYHFILNLFLYCYKKRKKKVKNSPVRHESIFFTPKHGAHIGGMVQ